MSFLLCLFRETAILLYSFHAHIDIGILLELPENPDDGELRGTFEMTAAFLEEGEETTEATKDVLLQILIRPSN